MTTQIKCIIVDDEPLAIEVLEQHIAQMPEMTLLASYQNPLEAFELLKTQQTDVVFLDIHMPLMSGIDLLKSLPHRPHVIFTTAHRDYAVESYELEVVDYLLKPVSFPRFFQAVNKYRNLVRKSAIAMQAPSDELKDDHLYVNVNKRFVKIRFEEIRYVESVRDYVKIHRIGEPVITRDSMSEFEKRLPARFLRIHRSFIVNTDLVTAFTSRDVEIGQKEIPIGDSYRKFVTAVLKKEFPD